MIKTFTLLVVFILWANTRTHHTNYIDPTGTYVINSKTTKNGNDIYGYSGQVQVKKITPKKIAMTFWVNKGAPSYNSGSFIDTMDYQNNIAVYKTPDIDTSCLISFTFTQDGVSVKEKTADFNCGCGFGHAVVADGFFRKTSSKQPVFKNPGTGEIIK